jgi:hypothetical protein
LRVRNPFSICSGFSFSDFVLSIPTTVAGLLMLPWIIISLLVKGPASLKALAAEIQHEQVINSSSSAISNVVASYQQESDHALLPGNETFDYQTQQFRHFCLPEFDSYCEYNFSSLYCFSAGLNRPRRLNRCWSKHHRLMRSPVIMMIWPRSASGTA